MDYRIETSQPPRRERRLLQAIVVPLLQVREVRAQNGEVLGSKSHSCWVAEVGFESRSLCLGGLISKTPWLSRSTALSPHQIHDVNNPLDHLFCP